ncbi:MAG: DNA-directed RNA polymerase subunit omega [Acidobacteriia bacterium]|nr:DNA-directed RNA polymerase subunit omega [Terriglobia bacterium]
MIKTPPGVDSKFRYVLIAAKRARQLQGGSAPLTVPTGKKCTRVAREELEQNLLKFEILPPTPVEGEGPEKKRKR